MSTIQMIVELCNCCLIPVANCEVTQDLIIRGIDPDLITHEVLCPEDVNDIDTRLHTWRTQGTG